MVQAIGSTRLPPGLSLLMQHKTVSPHQCDDADFGPFWLISAFERTTLQNGQSSPRFPATSVTAKPGHY